jgi:hypothetical protein
MSAFSNAASVVQKAKCTIKGMLIVVRRNSVLLVFVRVERLVELEARSVVLRFEFFSGMDARLVLDYYLLLRVL